jgi:uncharacterized protein YbbC (DUF1343 family)
MPAPNFSSGPYKTMMTSRILILLSLAALCSVRNGPTALFTARGTKHLAPFQTEQTGFPTPDTRHPIPDPKHQTPNTEIQNPTPAVKTGIEVLVERRFAPLKGRRVGLITNRAGVTSDGQMTIDLLANTPEVKLIALFAPEHGIRGTAEAGAKVGHSRDAKTGLPIYSLYGQTRKPTARMLRGLDALVYDLQDTGQRSYTYISTLGLCMEAAAEHDLAFFVLDRPNPLGGERIEGNIPTSAFRSFVGKYPIPYLYGLTAGELARMIQGEGWLGGKRRTKLTVIPLQNWRRDMTWEDTGLPWIPTSPNVPRAETSRLLAATGIAGELSALDVGVRTAEPFAVIGAPGLNAEAFAQTLNNRTLPGVAFQPAAWQSRFGPLRGKRCHGVRLAFPDPAQAEITRLNFEVLDALRRARPGLPLFPASRARMFDLVCGTDTVRKHLQAGVSVATIWKRWNADSVPFRRQREKYLLYGSEEKREERKNAKTPADSGNESPRAK